MNEQDYPDRSGPGGQEQQKHPHADDWGGRTSPRATSQSREPALLQDAAEVPAAAGAGAAAHRGGGDGAATALPTPRSGAGSVAGLWSALRASSTEEGRATAAKNQMRSYATQIYSGFGNILHPKDGPVPVPTPEGGVGAGRAPAVRARYAEEVKYLEENPSAVQRLQEQRATSFVTFPDEHERSFEEPKPNQPEQATAGVAGDACYAPSIASVGASGHVHESRNNLMPLAGGATSSGRSLGGRTGTSLAPSGNPFGRIIPGVPVSPGSLAMAGVEREGPATGTGHLIAKRVKSTQ